MSPLVQIVFRVLLFYLIWGFSSRRDGGHGPSLPFASATVYNGKQQIRQLAGGGGGGGEAMGSQSSSKLPSSKSSAPYFLYEPPGRVLFSNDTGAVIGCISEGHPKPRISWHYKSTGEELMDIPSLRFSRSDGSLVIFPFPPERYRQDIHETTYQCHVSNAFGTITSRFVKIRGVVHQEYRSQVYDEFVVQGSPAILKCHLPSFVKDFVSVVAWIRVNDGLRITASDPLPGPIGKNYQLLDPEGHLYVKNVSRDDNKTKYRCQTMDKINGKSYTSTDGMLIVTGLQMVPVKPKVIYNQAPLHLEEGSQLALTCIASGFPGPRYQWYKTDSDGVLNKMVGNSPVLAIGKASQNDSGKYIAIASNEVGEETCEIFVNVKAALGVHVEPQNLVIEIGLPLSLSCFVRGFPINQVVWMKNAKLINPGNGKEPLNGLMATNRTTLGHSLAFDMERERMERMKRREREREGEADWDRYSFPSPSRLHIRSTRREDLGMYQCFAINEEDSAQGMAAITLADSGPVLVSAFSEVFVEPGQAVSMGCTAYSVPQPTISWSVDGVLFPVSPASQNNRASIGDYSHSLVPSQISSHLNISSARVEDSGLYSCLVINDVSSVTHSGRLNVYGPPFVKPFRNVSAILEEDIALECPFGGYPIESLSWERNGISLPLNSRQLVDNKTGKLSIKRVQKEDSGSFKCVARNNKNESATGITFIRVVAPPVIDAHFLPESIVAEEGTRSRLICSINKGDPPVVITWFKDRKPLQTSSPPSSSLASPSSYHSYHHNSQQTSSESKRHFLIQNQEDFSSTILFRNVHLMDRGRYTCLAQNKVGAINRTTEFIVHSPPKWIMEPPQNVSGILNREIIIHCSADGYPPPSLSWKVGRGGGGGGGGGGGRNEFRSINSNDMNLMRNGSLHFRRLREEDETFYLCSASNGIGGGISKAIFLKVHKPPQTESKYSAIGVRKDKEGMLECSAKGDLPILFLWQKDGQRLAPRKKFALREENRGDSVASLLTMSPVEREDQGLYTCHVSNKFGKTILEIRLTVLEAPSRPANVTALNITSRTLTLGWSPGFDGNSPIKRYRLLYRQQMRNGIKGVATEGESVAVEEEGDKNRTVLLNLQPISWYTVTISAQNEVGSSDNSEPLNVTTLEEAPEGPPVEVKAQSTGSQSLKVSWMQPREDLQHGVLLGYYIGYKVVGSSDQYQYKHFVPQEEDHQQLSYTIYLTNLKRLTKYSIGVQAYNKAGAGPLSDSVEATTLETSPPISPSLTVVSTTNSSIRLMWEKDEKDKSIITEYALYYKQENKKDWKEIKVAPNLQDYLLDNLLCGTRYTLYMTATNSLGTGEPGQSINTRTRGAAPVSPAGTSGFLVINSSEVTLNLASWNEGGCPIHYFNVQRKQKHSKQWTLIHEKLTLRSHNKHLVLRNFLPGREYSLQVVATNDAGHTQATYDIKIPPVTFTQLTTKIPSVSINKNDYMVFDNLPLYRNFALILPIVISFTVILLLLVVVYWCLRTRAPEPHYSFPEQGKPTTSVSLSELSSQKSASRLNVTPKGGDSISNLRSDSIHSQLSNFGGQPQASPQKHFTLHAHEYAEPYSMGDPRLLCSISKDHSFATIKRANPRTRASLYGHEPNAQSDHFILERP